MSRKLEEKRARREARELRERQARRARRRSNLLTIGITVVIAGLVVFLILQERSGNRGAVRFGPAAAQAGCTPARRAPSEGQRHLANGTMFTGYRSIPPTSGPHWETPADPRFYDQPIPLAQVVHNLEHGQIVIYYQGLSGDEQDRLEAYVNDARPALLAMPAPEGLRGELVMTAWTVTQSCDEASSAAIDAFRQRFQGRMGPERLTPPFES